MFARSFNQPLVRPFSRLRQEQRISRYEKRQIRLRRFGRSAQLGARADGGGNLHEVVRVIILCILLLDNFCSI